jgi:hypothetical protein
MNPTWRKPVGMAAILVIIAIWAVAIVSLSPWVSRWPDLAQLAFYAFFGLVWILPLKPLLLWMETGKWRE